MRSVGTPREWPIQFETPEATFWNIERTLGGNVVCQQPRMRRIAGRSGRPPSKRGERYFRATTSESEIDALYNDISGLEKKELESRLFQNYEDRFSISTGAGILLLFAELWISERRKPGVSWLRRLHQIGSRHWRSAVGISFAGCFCDLLGSSELGAESLASKGPRGESSLCTGKVCRG